MPILNFRDYGETVLGFKFPFTEDEVKEQMEIEAILKKERATRARMKPKAIELTGTEFILFCDSFNSMNDKEFKVYRDKMYEEKRK